MAKRKIRFRKMVFVIVVYDISVVKDKERINKVRAYLRNYLNWVQNSVFEGSISKKDLRKMIEGLKKIVDEREDSIIIYVFPFKFYATRLTIGREKGFTDNVL